MPIISPASNKSVARRSRRHAHGVPLLACSHGTPRRRAPVRTPLSPRPRVANARLGMLTPHVNTPRTCTPWTTGPVYTEDPSMATEDIGHFVPDLLRSSSFLCLVDPQRLNPRDSGKLRGPWCAPLLGRAASGSARGASKSARHRAGRTRPR